MHRLSALIIGFSVAAAACNSYNAPSQETTTTSTFNVALSPADEVPPVTNADASGAGTAAIDLTVTKDDSDNITSASMTFRISVTGFPAGTTITKAHIHNAAVGVSGAVFVDTTLASGEMTITNGGGSITKSGIIVPPASAAAILANPGGHYFNVHTALNPDGAIRGQLATPR
jgi:hypothetical protein